MATIELAITSAFFEMDITVGDTGLELDQGLETAILLSLFSDARCTDEELPDGEVSKRGYWGNMFAEIEGDNFGSKLWLFVREKQTLENLKKIEDTSTESLQWFIDDGVAKSVAVRASYPKPEHTLIEADITKPNGKIYAFKILWDGQRLKRA